MNKMDEIILAASRVKLFEEERLAFQGVLTKDNDDNKMKIGNILSNLEFNLQSVRRGDAEENNALKQPIPYAIIRRGKEVFVYERLNGGGETRLHNKLSIGVGGHMNPTDARAFVDILTDNLEREIYEELDIQSESEVIVNYLGLINDDMDEVGEVHLGILVVLSLSEDAQVEVLEKEQLRGFWLTVDQLKEPETYGRLENWSKISVDAM